MTTMTEKNKKLDTNFTQVCVWPGTVVGKTRKEIKEFVQWGLTEFGVRLQYLEEIETKPDGTGPGGRSDLFFAIHSEDVGKFAVPRIAYGIRWIEDVFGNHQGHLYPDRVAEYKSWDATTVESDDEDEGY